MGLAGAYRSLTFPLSVGAPRSFTAARRHRYYALRCCCTNLLEQRKRLPAVDQSTLQEQTQTNSTNTSFLPIQVFLSCDSNVYKNSPGRITCRDVTCFMAPRIFAGAFLCQGINQLLKTSSSSLPSLLATATAATESPTQFRLVTSISMGRLMARISA